MFSGHQDLEDLDLENQFCNLSSLSGPQFSHLQNERNSSTFRKSTKTIHVSELNSSWNIVDAQ